MKKYLAILFSVLFLFATVGFVFAQAGKQDAAPTPIEGKKTEKSEKRQAVTPDKKKAVEENAKQGASGK